MVRTLATSSLILLTALAAPVFAQDGEGLPLPPPGNERLFGFEFEFAGAGNRVVKFEDMPWENYQRLMAEIVGHFEGDPREIRRVDFVKATTNLERYPSGERALFRAEWTDARGRLWQVVPEFVASGGYDGYEVVTPPMDDPAELERVLGRVRESGLVREGRLSGVHLTIDGRKLVTPEGNARALTNLIMLHENLSPTLRRLFNPVRHGGFANRFARSLSTDHPGLLEQIDALAPEERTRERLERIFASHGAAENAVQEVDAENANSLNKPWKYREMNLAKILQINELHDGRTETVEFRMFDLDSAETHRLEAELYRRMVRHAEELAERGIDVRLEPRAAQPAGEDPSVHNTPDNVEDARAATREMIERLGLEPARFEELIDRNVVDRALPTASEVRLGLAGLTRDRVLHNGQAFTYGFELEGSGSGFSMLSVPKDAAVAARWESMSPAQKRAYYESVVGSNRHAVKTHFELDLERYPWLDPNWKVEGTGNWEIRSLPGESIGETTDRMRLVKRLTGRSAKGFHLHMRDNGIDMEALKAKGPQFGDFLERAANWVWLQRARYLGTMTSMKSWSNARPTPSTVENWANVKASTRTTIRTGLFGGVLDVEIRGLTLRVDDIENLAKVFTERLRTLEFGPWEHTDNPMPAGSMSGRAPAELSLKEHLAEYMRSVEGVEPSAELLKIADALQHEFGEKAVGRARTYSTNVATPLLPWESEGALSESMRRDMRFAKEDFLRSVRFTAEKVANGEYGLDLEYANERALAEGLNLRDGVAERLVELRRENGGRLPGAEQLAEALGGAANRGELSRIREALEAGTRVDATEVARQMRYKVKNWSRSHGLAQELFNSLLSRPGRGEREAVREGFAPARRSRSGGASRISAETVSEVFESVRRSAQRTLPRGAAGIGIYARLRDAQLEVVESSLIDAHAEGSRIRITTGMLNEIDARAKSFSPEERPEFRRRALGLILSHEVAHVGGASGERAADAQAVRILRGTNLGRIGGVDMVMNDAELRETLRVFEAPSGGSRVGNLVGRLRGLRTYGTSRGRLQALRQTTRRAVEAAAPRTSRTGLPLPSLSRERRGETDRAAESLLGLRGSGTDRTFDRGETTAREGAPVRDRTGISEFLGGHLERAVERPRTRTRRGR